MKKFFTKYDRPDSKNISFDPDSSLTIQSEKDSADINKIIKQYKETGTLPNSRPKAFSTRYPQFGDFSSATDFTSCMLAIDASKNAFAELPSAVRKRFGNNPQELLTFLSDPANREEAENLGLIEKQIKQIIPVEKPIETTSPVKDVVAEVGNEAIAK